MPTTGTFDFNLEAVENVVDNSTYLGARVIKELADMGDIIGLGIAIAVALSLIAVGIMVVIGIPFLIIRKVKSYRKA